MVESKFLGASNSLRICFSYLKSKGGPLPPAVVAVAPESAPEADGGAGT
jgi:hypothetical protein